MDIIEDKVSRDNPVSSDVLVRASGLSFIEQLQIVSSKQCQKEKRPYLVGVNENVKICVLSQPACKMWNCEACGARNARKWIAKIINGCNKLGGQWSFLTLTAHKSKRKSASISNLRKGWKLLYNRILATMGGHAENLSYAKVFEQHENGAFHLHILINICLGTRWAKDNSASCGMGYMADWHEVDNAGQIAGYIAKYSLKNANIARGGIEWPKGLRRIETSRNWPDLPELKASEEIGWIVKMTRDEQTQSAQRYFIRGFEVIDTVREKKED